MNHFRLNAVTPNWFASVMGTGIVANALVGFPGSTPAMHAAALGFWALAALMLLFLCVSTVIHWIRYPQEARGHHRHPVMSHFYGAPPMAFLTVGAGTLLIGHVVVGMRAALVIDTVLWSLGTVLGLLSAVVVPYLVFTTQEVSDDSAFGGWLMPVVPPMVSAATGAMLLPFVHGSTHQTLFLACLAMFGLSLFASIFVIAQLWTKLTQHKVGAATLVPTLWIVLGPLGQGVTALTLLGRNSGNHAMFTASVIAGTPILGFALLWLALASAITVRTARGGMPFALTWWSFTFPVGTCATGSAGLAIVTGSTAMFAVASGFLLLLVGAWILVAIRTVSAQRPQKEPREPHLIVETAEPVSVQS